MCPWSAEAIDKFSKDSQLLLDTRQTESFMCPFHETITSPYNKQKHYIISAIVSVMKRAKH